MPNKINKYINKSKRKESSGAENPVTKPDVEPELTEGFRISDSSSSDERHDGNVILKRIYRHGDNMILGYVFFKTLFRSQSNKQQSGHVTHQSLYRKIELERTQRWLVEKGQELIQSIRFTMIEIVSRIVVTQI